VSKANINFNGWIGCGYIIIDPESGAGAYKIGGGANGGWITILQGVLHGIAGLLMIPAGLLVLAYSAPLAGAIILALSIVYLGLALCEISSDSRYIDVSVGLATAVFPMMYGVNKLIQMVFWAIGATITFSGNFFRNVCGG
jgi:hypothetical protein